MSVCRGRAPLLLVLLVASAYAGIEVTDIECSSGSANMTKTSLQEVCGGPLIAVLSKTSTSVAANVSYQLRVVLSTVGPFLLPSELQVAPLMSKTLTGAELPSSNGGTVRINITGTLPAVTSCGTAYIVVAVVAGTTVSQGAVPGIVPCTGEDVDLKWTLPANNSKASITVTAGQNIASGLTLSLSNAGKSALKQRMALDAVEVKVILAHEGTLPFFLTEQAVNMTVEDMSKNILMNLDHLLLNDAPEALLLMTHVNGADTLLFADDLKAGRALAAGSSLSLALSSLRVPQDTPSSGTGLPGALILVLDPFNRTADSNRTNNVIALLVNFTASAPMGTDHGGLFPGSSWMEGCKVVPSVEDDGQSALIVSLQSMPYMYDGDKGGFRKADSSETKTAMMRSMKTRQATARLKAMGRCTEDLFKASGDDPAASMADSQLGKMRRLVVAASAGVAALTPKLKTDVARSSNNKTKILLEAAQQLLATALDGDDKAKAFILQMLTFKLKSHLMGPTMYGVSGDPFGGNSDDPFGGPMDGGPMGGGPMGGGPMGGGPFGGPMGGGPFGGPMGGGLFGGPMGSGSFGAPMDGPFGGPMNGPSGGSWNGDRLFARGEQSGDRRDGQPSEVPSSNSWGGVGQSINFPSAPRYPSDGGASAGSGGFPGFGSLPPLGVAVPFGSSGSSIFSASAGGSRPTSSSVSAMTSGSVNNALPSAVNSGSAASSANGAGGRRLDTPPTAATWGERPDGTFRCRNGDVTSTQYAACDGYPDCTDSSDEENCGFGVSALKKGGKNDRDSGKLKDKKKSDSRQRQQKASAGSSKESFETSSLRKGDREGRDPVGLKDARKGAAGQRQRPTSDESLEISAENSTENNSTEHRSNKNNSTEDNSSEDSVEQRAESTPKNWSRHRDGGKESGRKTRTRRLDKSESVSTGLDNGGMDPGLTEDVPTPAESIADVLADLLTGGASPKKRRQQIANALHAARDPNGTLPEDILALVDAQKLDALLKMRKDKRQNKRTSASRRSRVQVNVRGESYDDGDDGGRYSGESHEDGDDDDLYGGGSHEDGDDGDRYGGGSYGGSDGGPRRRGSYNGGDGRRRGGNVGGGGGGDRRCGRNHGGGDGGRRRGGNHGGGDGGDWRRGEGGRRGGPGSGEGSCNPISREAREMEEVTSKLLMRLMISEPEDMKEFSFLPLSLRKALKAVISDVMMPEEPPQVCLPWRTAAENSTVLQFLPLVLMQMAGYMTVPTAETMQQALTYLKTNVSQDVRAYHAGNASMLALLDLSLLYMDIAEQNLQLIFDLMAPTLDPDDRDEMMESVRGKPGMEPSLEDRCARLGRATVTAAYSANDQTVQSSPKSAIFPSPMDMLVEEDGDDDENRDPVYWRVESKDVLRGTRSSLTGAMMWDKVAVCSCSGSSAFPDHTHGRPSGHRGPDMDGGPFGSGRRDREEGPKRSRGPNMRGGAFGSGGPNMQGGPMDFGGPFGSSGPYNQREPMGSSGPYMQDGPFGSSGPNMQGGPFGSGGPNRQGGPYGSEALNNQGKLPGFGGSILSVLPRNTTGRVLPQPAFPFPPVNINGSVRPQPVFPFLPSNVNGSVRPRPAPPFFPFNGSVLPKPPFPFFPSVVNGSAKPQPGLPFFPFNVNGSMLPQPPLLNSSGGRQPPLNMSAIAGQVKNITNPDGSLNLTAIAILLKNVSASGFNLSGVPAGFNLGKFFTQSSHSGSGDAVQLNRIGTQQENSAPDWARIAATSHLELVQRAEEVLEGNRLQVSGKVLVVRQRTDSKKIEFGTICDDGWGEEEARVVCGVVASRLQLPLIRASPSATFAPNAQGPTGVIDNASVMLDGVECQGDEQDILQCKHDGWGVHNCADHEAAFVTCIMH